MHQEQEATRSAWRSRPPYESAEWWKRCCVGRFLLDIDELFFQSFLSSDKKRALKAVEPEATLAATQ